MVKRKFKYIYLCLYEILFQYDGDLPFYPLCYRVYDGDVLIVELVLRLKLHVSEGNKCATVYPQMIILCSEYFLYIYKLI